MDIVKRNVRHTKVFVGDCVSIPSDFFGKQYQKSLLALGVEGRLYGRVVEVIEESNVFAVRWDVDEQITHNHKLGSVHRNTPIQQLPHDQQQQQPFATEQQQKQSSSKVAAETHAMIEETLCEPTIQYFLNVDGEDGSERHVMKATMYFTNPGVMVHNIPLPKTHQKFLIDAILQTDWEGFDEDRHCVGSFLAWDLSAVSEIGEIREIDDEEMEEGEEEGKGTKSKRKRTTRKAEKARMMRKKMRKLAEERDEDEEDNGEEGEVEEGSNEGDEELNEEEEEETEEEDQDDEWKEDEEKKVKRKGRKKTGIVEPRRNKRKEKKKVEVEGSEKKEKPKNKRKKRRASRANQKSKVNKATKVMIGKKAAAKKKDQNQTKKMMIEKETELDYTESSEEEIEKEKKSTKLESERKVWKEGGWNVNPKTRDSLRPKLCGELGDLFEDDSVLDYFLIYLPIPYIKQVVLPATNAAVKLQDPNYEPFTFNEFIRMLGILYVMEVVRLPERRLYWNTVGDGLICQPSILDDLSQ